MKLNVYYGSAFCLLVVMSLMIFFIGCTGTGTPPPTASPAPSSIATVQTQTAADFYKGKTITIICPTNPGGGADLLARITSTYLADKLSATVRVKNVTGGASMIGHNTLSKTSPDGLTIGVTNSDSLWLPWLMDKEGLEYNPSDFKYLSGWLAGYQVISVKPGGLYTSVEALKEAKIIKVAVFEEQSLMGFAVVTSSEILGLKSKIIGGYSGTGASLLAVMQGEVDAHCPVDSKAYSEKQQGQSVPLFVVSSKQLKWWPDLPVITDFKKDLSPFEQKLLDLTFPNTKVWIAPPDTPKDLVQFLSNTLSEISKDKAFQTSMITTNGYWDEPSSAENLTMQMQALIKNKAEYKNTLIPLLTKYK